MSPRGWRLRVQDILNSISEIESFISGMILADFSKNRMAQHAVVRCLEIIGEAAGHVPIELQNKYSEIPWRKLKDLRNLLIHQYFGVDEEIIWDALQKDLPPLKPKLQKILEKEVGE